MEITGSIAGSTNTNTYIISAFKSLLADEFVIMNKTSNCLLDASSPFFNIKSKFFQNIYDDLKKNTETISSALKQKTKDNQISISEIVTNTSIKKNNIIWKSKVAVLETLLADNLLVLSKLDEIITDLTIYGEKECVFLFKKIRECHRRISVKYRLFLKQIINYKATHHDKELG